MKKFLPYFLKAILIAVATGFVAGYVQAAGYTFVRMWPTLPQPWYFEPYDVAVDPEGYVYIADQDNHSIQKFTEDGAFVTQWDMQWGIYLLNPTGLSIDRYGNVFVVEAHSFQKFTSHGRKTGQWQAGPESYFFSVEVDARDWVYITDWNLDCIHVYTTDGAYVGRWGETGSGRGQFLQPASVAADPDGFIYVTDIENHTVQKFEVGLDKDGFFARFITSWGEEGESNGFFRKPFGITAGRGGVYVVDMLNNRVQKFDFEGNYLLEWGGEGTGDGLFYAAAGITAGPSGEIYVAGRTNQRVQKFTPDGRFLSAWQSHGDGRGMFDTPSGVALGEDGSLYVLDKNNDRVQKFSSKGEYILQWGQSGTASGEFDIPYGIAVHKQRVYVADTLNDRIQVFDTFGRYITEWGTGDTVNDKMNDPAAVAVDDQGFVYVADTENHRILKFTPDGGFITQWGRTDGTHGDAPGEFFNPYGLTLDGRYLYATDRDNERVQRIDTTGQEPIVTWNSAGDGNPDIHSPYGIAVDDAYVYVADRENHRVQVFRKQDIDSQGGPVRAVTSIGRAGFFPGLMNGPMDVAAGADGSIYIVDSENNRIQVFRQAEPALVEKAVIVAAGGPYEGNQLWPATQSLTNIAYLTLMHQGFTGDTVQYLSPDLGLDLDGNRSTDEVDGDATNEQLETAITSWAADADRLILYITDHGKTGTLRMNAEETLSAAQLDNWLDTLQQSRDVEVVLIYDACYAGSFIENLLPPEGKSRILMTSTGAGEDAYFIGQGAVSFSSFFWTDVLSGRNLQEVFDSAEYGMRGLQHPRIDADGDGEPGREGDFEIARTMVIGSGGDIPSGATEIESFTATFSETDSTARLIATGLTDPEGIARVWATAAPPDFEASAAQDSVLDMPTVPLLPSGGGVYAGEFSGLGENGAYTFRLFARDRLGNTVQLDNKSLDLADPLRHRAILVAGYSASPEIQEAVADATELARSALMFQGYDDDQDIQVLSAQSDLPGWDGPAEIAGIRNALTSWSVVDTRDLMFWFIGEGEGGAVRLNQDEMLDAGTLAEWLASVRAAVPGSVTVILDADGAGAAVPALAADPAGKTVVMASAPQDRKAVLQGGGAVSFSGFFWRSVFKGENAAIAFRDARDGLRLVAGVAPESGPILEADGNGIGNEWEDSRYAADLTIGSGIRLTADAPTSKFVSPPVVISGNTPTTIRIEDVVSAGEMDRVWAVVTPPDIGMGNVAAEPMQVNLEEAGPGVYEGLHDNWPWYGPYSIAIFGRDADGAVSRLEETEVFREDGEDVYEDDIARDQRPLCVVDYPAPQHRSFHSNEDSDRALFFAIAGKAYTLQARNPGIGCDIEMEIQGEDGRTIAVEDTNGPGGEERLPWSFTETGLYSVLLTNKLSADGKNAGYEFSIQKETGAFFGYLRGKIQDAVTGRPIVLARVRTTANGAALSRLSGSFLMFHEPGSFDITISAPGYLPRTLPATTVSEGGSTVLDIGLQPAPTPPPPVIPPEDPDSFPEAAILSPVDPLTVQVGDSVTFQGNVTSGDPPFRYEWDFSGAAEKSTLLNPPSVPFREPGAFRVTFSVVDADGDRSQAFVMISVTEKPDDPLPVPDTQPIASIVSPAGDLTLVQGESARFAGSAIDGNGTLTYRWTFDGAAGDSYALIPGDVVFPDPGDFAVRFVAEDQDGDRSEAGVLVTVRAKTPKPTLSEPFDGSTDVTLSPILFAAETTDPPAAFFHEATRWQIAVDSDFTQLVLDRVTDRFLTTLPVPELLLAPGREYFWRAQFNFDDGSVSEWSDAGRFVTVTPDPEDMDGDGIADRQAVTDSDAAPAVCVRADAGGSVICVTAMDNAAAVEALRAIPESDVSETLNRPQSLPLGLLSFRIRVTDPIAPAVIKIDFMRPVTADVDWYGYDPFSGWNFDSDMYTFNPDRSGVVLTLQDGGARDLDGISNGIIVHISGAGSAPVASDPFDFEGPGDSVGGGCFIETQRPSGND